ncbi:hypothetical protein [Marinactinospora rubrisoli]|uniref:Uncharacterized protein n=1 Tax=Marinactinospora rubrisoli TaxID=2715399 RepID=A0ABW2KN31_9ACTN
MTPETEPRYPAPEDYDLYRAVAHWLPPDSAEERSRWRADRSLTRPEIAACLAHYTELARQVQADVAEMRLDMDTEANPYVAPTSDPAFAQAVRDAEYYERVAATLRWWLDHTGRDTGDMHNVVIEVDLSGAGSDDELHDLRPRVAEALEHACGGGRLESATVVWDVRGRGVIVDAWTHAPDRGHAENTVLGAVREAVEAACRQGGPFRLGTAAVVPPVAAE